MARQAQTSVMGDYVPYEAGVVIITPLDKNGVPDKSKAVATQRDFLQSPQTSETRTMETLANGHGNDKPIATGAQFKIAVIANVSEPRFHALAANRTITELAVGDTANVARRETTIVPLKVGLTDPYTYEVAFGTTTAGGVTATPAMDADGDYDIMVQDGFGNFLENGGAAVTTLEVGIFEYDSGTKIMSFSADYEEIPLRCVFYEVMPYGGMKIENNEQLSTPMFRVEVFGYAKSAESEEVYPRTTIIERATYDGDITDTTTQKSINNPLTYNFTSAPVPKGVKVFKEYIEALSTAVV